MLLGQLLIETALLVFFFFLSVRYFIGKNYTECSIDLESDKGIVTFGIYVLSRQDRTRQKPKLDYTILDETRQHETRRDETSQGQGETTTTATTMTTTTARQDKTRAKQGKTRTMQAETNIIIVHPADEAFFIHP